MADSTTHLDLITVNQKQQEVTANELFDALSPALLYGRRASRCSYLTWAYYGGRWRDNAVSHGAYQLDPEETWYMVADRSTGGVTFSTDDTNWNDDENYARLYKIVTDELEVTSYEDHRSLIGRVE